MSIVYEYNANMLGFHHSIDKKPEEKNFSMHVHDQYEILFFVSGKGSFTIEGSTYNLVNNCLLLMSPAEFHKISISNTESYERMVVHFKKEALIDFDKSGFLTKIFDNRQMGYGNMYLSEEFGDFNLKPLFEGMKADGNNDEKHLAIIANLLPILYKINSLSETHRIHPQTRKKNEVLSELVYFINRHLCDNLSLEVLSNHFFLSKSQLNRIFRESTGTSIWEYIILKRLMSARTLIHSGVPIIKASQQFGFVDYSSFYRAYRKHFNISPKNDAKMQKGN